MIPVLGYARYVHDTASVIHTCGSGHAPPKGWGNARGCVEGLSPRINPLQRGGDNYYHYS